MSLDNTAIAGNTLEAGGSGPDVSGTVNSLGFNLIRTTTGAIISGKTTGNLSGVDPLLAPLQSNGGLTPTRMPLPGSPLANAGDPAVTTVPATDHAARASLGWPAGG